jgi:hypothetical protein
MNTTSLGLLERLKLANPDAADWQRLQDLYLPLIRHLLSRLPGLHDEIDDLTQEVFLFLLRELPAFERRRHGSFRAWLRQITVHRTWAFYKSRRKRPTADGGRRLGGRTTSHATRRPRQRAGPAVGPGTRPIRFPEAARPGAAGLRVGHLAGVHPVCSRRSGAGTAGNFGAPVVVPEPSTLTLLGLGSLGLLGYGWRRRKQAGV